MKRKKTEEDTQPLDFANDVAKGVALISASLEPAYESAKGYRNRAIEDGWSEEAAEMMAVQYHGNLMAHFIPQNNSFEEGDDGE